MRPEIEQQSQLTEQRQKIIDFVSHYRWRDMHKLEVDCIIDERRMDLAKLVYDIIYICLSELPASQPAIAAKYYLLLNPETIKEQDRALANLNHPISELDLAAITSPEIMISGIEQLLTDNALLASHHANDRRMPIVNIFMHAEQTKHWQYVDLLVHAIASDPALTQQQANKLNSQFDETTDHASQILSEYYPSFRQYVLWLFSGEDYLLQFPKTIERIATPLLLWPPVRSFFRTHQSLTISLIKTNAALAHLLLVNTNSRPLIYDYAFSLDEIITVIEQDSSMAIHFLANPRLICSIFDTAINLRFMPIFALNLLSANDPGCFPVEEFAKLINALDDDFFRSIINTPGNYLFGKEIKFCFRRITEDPSLLLTFIKHHPSFADKYVFDQQYIRFPILDLRLLSTSREFRINSKLQQVFIEILANLHHLTHECYWHNSNGLLIFLQNRDAQYIRSALSLCCEIYHDQLECLQLRPRTLADTVSSSCAYMLFNLNWLIWKYERIDHARISQLIKRDYDAVIQKMCLMRLPVSLNGFQVDMKKSVGASFALLFLELNKECISHKLIVSLAQVDSEVSLYVLQQPDYCRKILTSEELFTVLTSVDEWDLGELTTLIQADQSLYLLITSTLKAKLTQHSAAFANMITQLEQLRSDSVIHDRVHTSPAYFRISTRASQTNGTVNAGVVTTQLLSGDKSKLR